MSLEAPPPSAPSGGSALLALVLGIVGLLGSMGSCCCCLFMVPALCAPVAWFLGHRELSAIRAGRVAASEESSAQVGMILGIIGTAVLALYLVLLVVYVALVGLGAATEVLKHGGVPPLPR